MSKSIMILNLPLTDTANVTKSPLSEIIKLVFHLFLEPKP